jgi:hypothetical protein
MWYEAYRLPLNAFRRYQYPIFDNVLTGRVDASLEEASSFSRAMPRLDMLVILPDEIQLIEFKPNAQLKDVGQILQYETSLKRDVFLADKLTRPIRRIMCTLQDNANVRAMCAAQNIEYLVIPVSELPPPPE